MSRVSGVGAVNLRQMPEPEPEPGGVLPHAQFTPVTGPEWLPVPAVKWASVTQESKYTEDMN